MKKASKRDISKKLDIGKEQCQKWHCIKRIRQRLQINLSEEQYEHIISCIKNGKESTLCKLKYLSSQSNRLSVYEITFNGKEPVKVIYDKFRKTIVTILFPEDGKEITHYYDIFGNNINIKHELGYNKFWSYVDGMLQIPSENIIKKDGYFEVVSEGILFEKRFKMIDNKLYEVFQ